MPGLAEQLTAIRGSPLPPLSSPFSPYSMRRRAASSSISLVSSGGVGPGAPYGMDWFISRTSETCLIMDEEDVTCAPRRCVLYADRGYKPNFGNFVDNTKIRCTGGGEMVRLMIGEGP